MACEYYKAPVSHLRLTTQSLTLRSFLEPLAFPYAHTSNNPAVAMSSTAVHQPPPPFLFGQQQQHPAQPAMASSPPPPPPTADDLDMGTSTTLPPAGQRHDRDDADMQDGLTNGHEANTSNNQPHTRANNVAVEVAAVAADEDAMDTTSDDVQGIVLPNGLAEPQAPDYTSQIDTHSNENPVVHIDPLVSLTLHHTFSDQDRVSLANGGISSRWTFLQSLQCQRIYSLPRRLHLSIILIQTRLTMTPVSRGILSPRIIPHRTRKR